MHENTRKIVQVGGSLAVTLPKSWLRYCGLKAKDEVTVLSNGCVTIEPKKKVEKKK